MSVTTLGTASDHGSTLFAADDLEPAVLDVFQRYEQAWNSRHRDLLVGFWDDAADPVYLAEEQDDWITGRADIARYFVPQQGGASIIDDLVMHFRIEHVRPLGDHHALAAGWVRHDVTFVEAHVSRGVDARVTAVLRERDSVWRFVSYAEAHPRPTA